MSPFPVDPAARKRLQDAQRAETDALKTVEVATRARDRVQAKLDAAVAELNAAKVAMVGCSGLARAALLLAEDEQDLRRTCRAAGRAEKGTPGPEEHH